MTGCLPVSVSETSVQCLPDSTPQVATEQRETCVCQCGMVSGVTGDSVATL